MSTRSIRHVIISVWSSLMKVSVSCIELVILHTFGTIRELHVAPEAVRLPGCHIPRIPRHPTGSWSITDRLLTLDYLPSLPPNCDPHAIPNTEVDSRGSPTVPGFYRLIRFRNRFGFSRSFDFITGGASNMHIHIHIYIY